MLNKPPKCWKLVELTALNNWSDKPFQMWSETLTVWIGRLWMKHCQNISTSTIWERWWTKISFSKTTLAMDIIPPSLPLSLLETSWKIPTGTYLLISGILHTPHTRQKSPKEDLSHFLTIKLSLSNWPDFKSATPPFLMKQVQVLKLFTWLITSIKGTEPSFLLMKTSLLPLKQSFKPKPETSTSKSLKESTSNFSKNTTQPNSSVFWSKLPIWMVSFMISLKLSTSSVSLK